MRLRTPRRTKRENSQCRSAFPTVPGPLLREMPHQRGHLAFPAAARTQEGAWEGLREQGPRSPGLFPTGLRLK